MGGQIDGKAGVMPPGKILLLSGDSGSGKTTLCLNLLERIKKHPLKVAGVICPPAFDGNAKTGIRLLDLASGEERPLARLRDESDAGLSTHRWLFNEESILWGNERLAVAVPCDVLIVDELGPLEFERGLGFTNAFTAINSGQYRAALVVIRPSLLEQAFRRWPAAQAFMLDESNRDQLVGEFLELLA